MKQFILIINGPITGGKTYAADAIMNICKKVFRLSPNKIKFLISDYTPDRDRRVVHEAVMLMAEKMIQHGMSLLLEGGSVMQGTLNHDLAALGEKYGVPITVVNIEAPLPVLQERFADRLVKAATRGSKLSVTDDEGFMQRYNAYLSIKSEAKETFDSSKHSAGEIAQAIIALV